MWTKILGYWRAGLTLLLSLLASLLTFLTMRSRQNRKEKNLAERRYERAKEIAEQDKAIDLEHDVRTKKLAKQVEKDGKSDELSNPNNW